MARELMIFLACWLAVCAGMASIFAVIINFDRVAVFVLSEIDAPLFATAWGVAELIRRYPDQFEVSNLGLKHPALGVIRAYNVASLHIEGTHGDWQPNSIERRIIFDAVVWRQHNAIRGLLRKQIGSGTIEQKLTL